MAAAAWRNMYFTPPPPLHTVEISFWDDVTVAGRVKTADLYRNVLQQMFTDARRGGWSSSPLPWQWTDRQRCGLHHIWRAPHGLTDTGSRPSLLTHTHHKCLQWWSTWQSATRPTAKYTRACFDAWITLKCTADTVSLYHPLHSWQQIKTHNVLNLTHITSFPWG